MSQKTWIWVQSYWAIYIIMNEFGFLVSRELLLMCTHEEQSRGFGEKRICPLTSSYALSLISPSWTFHTLWLGYLASPRSCLRSNSPKDPIQSVHRDAQSQNCFPAGTTWRAAGLGTLASDLTQNTNHLLNFSIGKTGQGCLSRMSITWVYH